MLNLELGGWPRSLKLISPFPTVLRQNKWILSRLPIRFPTSVCQSGPEERPRYAYPRNRLRILADTAPMFERRARVAGEPLELFKIIQGALLTIGTYRRDKIRCDGADGARPCSGCAKKGYSAEQCVVGCENCRRARTKCEDGKPCKRCCNMQLECIDEVSVSPSRQDSTANANARSARMSANDRAKLACQNCRRDNKKVIWSFQSLLCLTKICLVRGPTAMFTLCCPLRRVHTCWSRSKARQITLRRVCLTSVFVRWSTLRC